jgi:hypothetical protein
MINDPKILFSVIRFFKADPIGLSADAEFTQKASFLP